MLEGPLIFVDVDTQRDFLEPDGALFISGSETIRPNLARLTQFARERGIPILATACAHAEGDPEFAVFPPHCLVGTSGQGRIDETAWPDGPVFNADDDLPASALPHLTVNKQQYDVFSVPEMGLILEIYSEVDPTFVVYGVATDYCVKCAVEGLLAQGKKVALVADAIRAVDPSSEADVLTRFVQAGALLTITDVVCA
jgi:nicotinamidase/pyrazinamidase